MSGDTLTEQMRKLGIRDTDLQERFARSSGPGRAKVNYMKAQSFCRPQISLDTMGQNSGRA
jgi:protein subunit release factor B